MNNNKKEVYVTGGAGLIGSFLCEILNNNGFKVFVIDDFSKGLLRNLDSCINDIEIIEADLQNYNQALNALKDAKIVYHLASRAYGVGYSKEHHIETLIHNELITNNLLRIFQNNQLKEILVTSSACVYSDDGPDIISEKNDFSGDPELANEGYGWAKRQLEIKFKLLAKSKNINLKITRPFNIYGERYRWVGNYSSAIPMIIKRVLDGEDPLISWGTGKQRRSYLHAYDCARLMMLIMNSDTKNIIVNIGTKETITIKELVHLICKLANKEPKIIFDKNKPEGRFIKSADDIFLKKIIEKEPISTINLSDGIMRMIEWYNLNFNNNK
tara:strand:+ start:1298 stop:2281 length:984 start_codon:yes stop_codon:yes gene_type:complete